MTSNLMRKRAQHSEPDGVHCYWIKNVTSLRIRISVQLNICLDMGVDGG